MSTPESVTARFIKAFVATNESHVIWLQKMTLLAETMGNPNVQQKIVDEINANPMKIKLSQLEALDWPHIHFVIAMAYAKAVLKCDAYIPNRDTSS
jgi:hypothetical protein